LILSLVVALLLGPIAGSASAKLVGHWRMDEGAGTVAYDTSGYGNNGNLRGDPAWTTGALGGALQLDGVDDFVEIPHSARLTVDDEVTVTAWLYAERYTGPNGAGYQGIIAKSNGTRSYSLYLQSDEVLHFSTAGVGTTSTGTIPLNEWVHLAAQVINGEHRYFINGSIAGSGGSGIVLPGASDADNVVIGKTWEADRELQGRVDDVRIYDNALDEAGVQAAMTAIPFTAALAVIPPNGTVVDTVQFALTWEAGDYAASHMVYFGESFDAVNTGQVTPVPTTQPSLETGLVPGYEAGLVAGQTYYWRVDEVNEAHPDSPWKGEVWSFTVQPLTAWNPSPADGAVCVLTDQALNWNAGLGAVFHTVYFSESYDDVANATAEALQVADPTFLVETLEAGKTYYWRVDEFALDMTGIPANFEGEVWSFSTVPDIAIADPHLVGWWTFDEGSSDTAVDSSGYGHHGILNASVERVEGLFGGALHFGSGRVVDCGFDAASEVTGDFTLAAWVQLDRTNAGVYGGLGGKLQYTGNYFGFGLVRHSSNFFRLWVGDGSTDLAKSAVGSNAPYTDTEWHHVAGVRNGQANTLYVDGVLQNATTNTGLAPSTDWFHIGRQYSTQTDRTFPGVIDDFRIYDTAATAATITQIMAGDENLASDPQPASGTVVDIRDVPDLLWSAGANAASHDVYFGTDRQAVAQADHEAAEFQGNQTDPSFSISDLATFGGGDYYWRIDEVEADGVTVRKGYVWKVTLPDYLPVDDFESYTDDEDAGTTIFQTWIDGLTNGTGSYVGYENANGETFGEIWVVHGGSQSMPFAYDNTKSPYYSETTRTWTQVQDWTAEGVDTLSLFVQGADDNGEGTLYVGLQDSTGKLGVVKSTNATLPTTDMWTQWTIPLADFGVKASAIKKMSIGIGDRDNPTLGGAGLIYVDDIRVGK